ncbi:23S rRNA (guanosine(2251)-2'-O)-methyltransferase RlmB [Candidatus Hydrogenosomobacter endosymbioticus]|uniref:RNA 2-O ribose methyltransferase substrate binding domain-containing protein n=1 Tax=Candidatus Hydrogenosomobacter endosymbioticus TaxID=2558174 RepID=A0ABM7V813_9PROT|nr:23S rRNA (guanosine(2251)-2'-O)-methyltransferase RlmB [Candidatus Hydrogenosomobacter endosymbioticus]BDB95895.1 hypothetical protein HYD_0280 [Candidatus Hydrogenosomobacter endosymbioticus]
MKSKHSRNYNSRANRARHSFQNMEIIWGTHAVAAALRNPQRVIDRLCYVGEMDEAIRALAEKKNVDFSAVTKDEMRELLRVGVNSVHQGIAAVARPLQQISVGDICRHRFVLLLDHVTDPHNVGAIWRNAAAFGVGAVVMTKRHSPSITGVIAKAAAGALDFVPYAYVSNLAVTIELLKKNDFTIIGLDESGKTPVDSFFDAMIAPPVALIVGGEGSGMRHLTKKSCDFLACIRTDPEFSTLNVSCAAAVGMHAIWRKICG